MAIGAAAGADGHRPLAGVRVLDFTAAWAGPMATRILGYSGATVVKVEAPTRPDSWRGFAATAVDRFPGRERGERWFDRNAWFNTQNHDKLSLGLDLKKPLARGVVERAVRWADVVIANFAAGVLDRLGLGFAALRAMNDRIVVVEMPAFGNTGPLSGHRATGHTMEAASGMSDLLGYGDGVPGLTGTYYLDPAGGLHGAAAVLTALHSRDRTGEAQYVELAQVEAALHWIGPQLLECLEPARPPRPGPAGNAVADAAPHDAYRCHGDDEWVAVHVDGEVAWAALCRVIGRADLRDAEAFRSVTARNAHADDLRASIEHWTSRRAKWDAARDLQANGVAAAPVLNGRDVALNPHLWAGGFFSVLSHDEAGTHPYPGLPVRWGRRTQPLQRAAPTYGRDNRYVLAGLLGCTEAEIAELAATGTTADAPVVGPGEGT